MALEGKGTNEWVNVIEWERGAGIQHQRGSRRLGEAPLVSFQGGCLARVALPRAMKFCESPR